MGLRLISRTSGDVGETVGDISSEGNITTKSSNGSGCSEIWGGVLSSCGDTITGCSLSITGASGFIDNFGAISSTGGCATAVSMEASTSGGVLFRAISNISADTRETSVTEISRGVLSKLPFSNSQPTMLACIVTEI